MNVENKRGLAREGAPEPVSRDQIFRRVRGYAQSKLLVQLTEGRIGNHIILYYYVYLPGGGKLVTCAVTA